MLYSPTQRAAHSRQPAELHLPEHRHDGGHARGRRQRNDVPPGADVVVGSADAELRRFFDVGFGQLASAVLSIASRPNGPGTTTTTTTAKRNQQFFVPEMKVDLHCSNNMKLTG